MAGIIAQSMKKTGIGFSLVAMLLLMAGCASLQKEFKQPSVSVNAIQALPSEGFAPQFEVDLHITNPNRFALALTGISYTISLEGHQIITGVANDLPEIAAYGEGEITLIATTDLFNSICLLTDLMRQPRDSFAYELVAELDLGGIYPNQYFSKKGELSLAPIRN